MLQVRHSVIYPGKQRPLDEFVSEYRRIYREADALFAKFNPCEIHDGECYQGRGHEDTKSFCCSKCDYLTDTGCSVEALYCKLWICGALRSRKELPKEFSEPLNNLIREAGVLCRRYGGRYDITKYIAMFYGQEELKKFEANRSKSGISAAA